MDGHLTMILGDDEVQAEARDASIHQQFFAAVDGLRGVTGDLDHDTRAAFDERVIISGIAQHLDVRVVVQMVTRLELLIRSNHPTANGARTREQRGRDIQRDAVVVLSCAG